MPSSHSRIRRIRCDQTRPVCQKCTSTGRTCDGYVPARALAIGNRDPSLPSVIPIIPRNYPPVWRLRGLSDPRGLTEQDSRFFHFFTHQTSIELDGDFRDNFWQQLVPQISHNSPCIYHGILAIAYLHAEHCKHQTMSGSEVTSEGCDFRSQAFANYNKTLKLLNHQIGKHKWENLHVTLTCCVLCIEIEWVLGNHASALLHLHNSLRVIREWQKMTALGLSASTTTLGSPAGHFIRSALLPLFTRFVLQAATLSELGQMILPANPRFEGSIKPISSLKEARERLYDLLAWGYGFAPIVMTESAPLLTKTVHSLQPEFTKWADDVASFLLKCDHREVLPPAILLQIWVRIVRIMLATKASRDETSFEKFTNDFSMALDLATTLYSLPTSTFSADISIIPVLYYTVAKCRDSPTRRRAISLLQRSPRREGIWHSNTAVDLAHQIIHKEESKA